MGLITSVCMVVTISDYRPQLWCNSLSRKFLSSRVSEAYSRVQGVRWLVSNKKREYTTRVGLEISDALVSETNRRRPS